MASGGFKWEDKSLQRNIQALPAHMGAAVHATMEFHAPMVENHAKDNAPWTDVTSNARNGLAARAYVQGLNTHGIVLFHQVPYGIWLETRWSGRYAIIVPTIREYGPKVMSSLRGMLTRLRGL